MSLSPRQQFALLPAEEQKLALEIFVAKGGDIRVLESAWRGWRARPEQLAPDGAWTFWYMETGRGFGKTLSAACWIHERIERMRKYSMAHGGLLHRTAADVREIMVEGPDGLLATAPPGKLPKYEPSKRKVTFYNGYVMRCYSAEEPDSLRGPSLSLGWADEFATYKGITGIDGLTAFDNFRFALRGRVPKDRPRAVITTTPKRVKAVKTMHQEAALEDSPIVITKGSLLDNAANLDPAYVAGILRKYAGTALGDQEIGGELATDVEGSLFKSSNFDKYRITDLDDVPELSRTAIAVDPSVGDGTGDECGIVAGAVSAGLLPTELRTSGGIVSVQLLKHLYVLEDASMSGPPDAWALAVSELAEKLGTTLVVAEQNQGGLMVRSVLRNVNPNLRVKLVNATKGKQVRAQPVATVFAQGRGHMVGEFGELEGQSTTWVPGEDSPDRMDALVWLGTYLLPEVAQRHGQTSLPDMSRRVG